MNKELREKAILLRTNKRMSYGEIKNRLGVSKSTLSYWLRDHQLSDKEILDLRRKNWSKGEVSRERYRKAMRKKKELKNLEVYTKEKENMKKLGDNELYLAGLMLYLGEGAKKKDSALVLANSDPRIIKFFIWWLEKFINIPRSDIRIQLHLYENMNLNREKIFWVRYLGLEDAQVYKLSVRKIKKNSFSYSESYMHGTCGLYAFGVERVRKVMMGMQAMLDSYC